MSVANNDPAVSSAGRRRRAWSWAAVLFAAAVWVGSIPTFGMSIFLSPIGLMLSAFAWRRAPHDGLFWVGLTLNAFVTLSLVGILVGLLTGDVSIGIE